MNSIAVVILNYNGKALLQQFLPTVISCSGDATIIVADNHSNDGSCEMLAADFPGVRVIRLNENKGYSGGYNAALQQVDATYYVLLNSDVEVTPGWLDPFYTLFEKDPSVGAAQPKVLAYHNRSSFEYAGAGGGYIDTLGYPFCRGRLFDTLEKDEGQYDDSRPIFWATGACLFVRSALFHVLGGLDEDFFAHMEEIDFCWKLHRSGHQVFYVGESTVWHVGGGTLPMASPAKTFYNFRNGISLLIKHLPPGQLAYKLPLRVLLDLTAMVRLVTKGQFAPAWSIFRALLYSLVGIPKNLRKRWALKHTLPYNVDLTYPHSIVTAYFLRNKCRFSELKFP